MTTEGNKYSISHIYEKNLMQALGNGLLEDVAFHKRIV